MTYELGSLIVVGLYVLWQIVKWIKDRGGDEVEHKYSDKKLTILSKQMKETCDKMDTCREEQIKTRVEVENLREDIHNGLSSDIKSILNDNIRQWKAVNANTSDISYLKGKERRKNQ